MQLVPGGQGSLAGLQPSSGAHLADHGQHLLHHLAQVDACQGVVFLCTPCACTTPASWNRKDWSAFVLAHVLKRSHACCMARVTSMGSTASSDTCKTLRPEAPNWQTTISVHVQVTACRGLT